MEFVVVIKALRRIISLISLLSEQIPTQTEPFRDCSNTYEVLSSAFIVVFHYVFAQYEMYSGHYQTSMVRLSYKNS